MKAIAIYPSSPGASHLVDAPEPSIDDIPGGRGVLVEILRVGLDGTDKELYQGEYGTAPEGFDYLITGHEAFGRVLAVGPAVTELAVGDLVTPTVRRPGSSPYDAIGLYDMTTDDVYYERGINLRHGFLTERIVESPEFLIHVPGGIEPVGVLTEPMSVVQKGMHQCWEIQRRLKVWRPRRAAVTGAGTIGLLACLALRLRGLEVTAFARTLAPNPNASLIEALGASYVSTKERSIAQVAADEGAFDIVFEATGFSPLVFEAAHVVAKNGVLVLTSVTGGDRTTEVRSDRLNLEFVLGNKVMFGSVNASPADFERGVIDFARAEVAYAGWLSRLLTHPIRGLESHERLFETLFEARDAIKVFLEVAG